MSDKIGACMDALEAALNTLVSSDGSGMLKRVRRAAVILPTTVVNPPECGLAVGRWARDGQLWTVDVAITAVAQRAGLKADEAATLLIAAMQDAIETLIDSGGAGALVDRPSWDAWYEPRNDGSGLQQLVILGQTKITVQDPLTA